MEPFTVKIIMLQVTNSDSFWSRLST